MSTDVTSVERRMARSAGWMVGLRLVDRAIGLVSVLFLARLLVPADFGLVAMGTVVMGALEAITAFGFEMALIQRCARDRTRWDSAWTLNVIIGVANAALIAALAPAAALFYGEPRVVNVMLVLAASALIAGFRNIGMVEFEQDLRFGPIVVLALLRRVASFVVTLALAWRYETYWALLAGMVTGHAIDLACSYLVSPYRPRLSLAAWRDLFSFSRWLLVINVLGYVSNRGGDAIIGTVAGAAALGKYTVSYELANLPTSEMVRPVTRAVFPGYAMMASVPARLAAGFSKVFSLVLLFALPAAAGIALLAEPLVAVLLGPRWSDTVPLLQVLAIFGGIRALQANTGSVYMALNRPEIAAAITAVGIVLELGAFAVALTRLPIAQAAWFLVIGGTLTAVVNLTVLQRLLGLRVRHLLRPALRPALGIALMALALQPLAQSLWNGGHPVATGAVVLVALVATGAIVYVATVLSAWTLLGRREGTAEHAIVALLAESVRRPGAPQGPLSER
jgi:lipopolysaccharide exporter